MAKSNKATNAGVHGSNGIEFQKHCALYLLFEKYEQIKDTKYFICLEHHDDFLFCYQTPTEVISSIDAYQAKKASSQWGMGADLSIILKKLTQVGLDLIADSHPKEPSYSHALKFITNNSIQLNCGKRKNGTSLLINEGNHEVKYLDIDQAIQDNVIKGLKKEAVNDPQQLGELSNLYLVYIDLPKKAKEQKDTLVGQFSRLFADKVHDSVAAIEALLLIFREVENVLNQGNIAQLMDKSKMIDSTSIKEAINIITSKAKSFEFWRNRGGELASKISISVFDQNRFKLQFQNSFDLFKDLKQTEHRKLLKYVVDNKTRWASHTDEVDCISDIYKSFIAEKSTNLVELDIKAAVCAAYLEIKE